MLVRTNKAWAWKGKSKQKPDIENKTIETSTKEIKNTQSNDTPTYQPVVKNLFTQPKKRGCEWPEGHPDEPEFHFCGKERFEEKPYCLNHCAIAYIIPEKEEVEQQQVVNSRIK